MIFFGRLVPTLLPRAAEQMLGLPLQLASGSTDNSNSNISISRSKTSVSNDETKLRPSTHWRFWSKRRHPSD